MSVQSAYPEKERDSEKRGKIESERANKKERENAMG
jgi:hypothetical protein